MSLASPTPASRGRTKRALFTLAYLLVLTATGLLGVELISRRFFHPESIGVSSSGEIEYDPLAGWRGRRSFSGEVPHGRHPVPIRVAINSDGFRDESWDRKLERAAQSQARKILLVGDSLLYGWANPAEDRLSEQLQARYELAGRKAVVFNAGIPAYGPNHQLRLLPELLERIHPDEVVVLFCVNDFGDVALPYDFRYPFRVYQPFYGTDGSLLFNREVPRRPSLAMRDTMLGQLRLWYAVDQLSYAWEDRRYADYGIPSARTAPVDELNGLFGDAQLRKRLPYVEATVLSLYERMSALCQAAGARFTVFASVTAVAPLWERVDALLGAPLKARGVRYLSCPVESEGYYPWTPTLLDGHPNLIWAWILAGALYGDLEQQPAPLSFEALPQLDSMPTELELGNDASSARWLAGDWKPADEGARGMGSASACLLRTPGAGALELSVTGSAPHEVQLRVTTLAGLELCRLSFGPTGVEQACPVPAGSNGPVTFLAFSEPAAEAPSVRIQRVRLASRER